MRLDDLYIRGTGVWLPPRLTIAEAVAAGECPPNVPERTGSMSVTVSTRESAAEMAVLAARSALDRSGSFGSDVDLILHADTYYQGRDVWAVASYVQHETVDNQCPAIEIRQMSNGGMASLELAASYLIARPERSDALLTTADRFCSPGFDRWRTDPGTPYADGGAALVLSRRGGYARLRALAVHADPVLEPLHRGDEPFGTTPLAHGAPLRFDGAARAFNRRHGMSFSMRRIAEGQSTVLERVLAEAEVELDDIDWFVLPNFGYLRLESFYYNRYGIDPDRTTWNWGRTVGHLGAGDQFAGLDHLVTSGMATPGSTCLLLGVGAGYSWGGAVVEIQELPSWSAASTSRS